MKRVGKTRGIWRVARFMALWLGCLVASSCGDTQNEYTSHHCYFVFDNQTHNDPTLAAAMTPYSGVFTTISLTTKGGARYFVFKSNQNISSDKIFNNIDSQRTLILGMNDGIIVGYGTLSDPLTFYAYDRECPNCYDDSRIPIRSFPITVSSNGIGTCNNCHRQYDLNNGGIIGSGDGGLKLTRYRASTTGPYGILTVN